MAVKNVALVQGGGALLGAEGGFDPALTYDEATGVLTLAGGISASPGSVASPSLTIGTFISMPEQAVDPAAPAANTARFYARDNGAGKTQLVVRFPTGAVQVIATEP